MGNLSWLVFVVVILGCMWIDVRKNVVYVIVVRNNDI